MYQKAPSKGSFISWPLPTARRRGPSHGPAVGDFSYFAMTAPPPPPMEPSSTKALGTITT